MAKMISTPPDFDLYEDARPKQAEPNPKEVTVLRRNPRNGVIIKHHAVRLPDGRFKDVFSGEIFGVKSTDGK